MNIILFSFGFKHGPAEADCVWDVRFLPNPYWVDALRPFTGKDERVARHVLDNRAAADFLNLLTPLLFFLLDHYQAAKRETVRLAIGCTGGKHRSVALVEHLNAVLRAKGYDPIIRHRDMDRE